MGTKIWGSTCQLVSPNARRRQQENAIPSQFTPGWKVLNCTENASRIGSPTRANQIAPTTQTVIITIGGHHSEHETARGSTSESKVDIRILKTRPIWGRVP